MWQEQELYSLLCGDMTLPTYFSKVPNQDKDDTKSHDMMTDLNDKICADDKSLSLVHP